MTASELPRGSFFVFKDGNAYGYVMRDGGFLVVPVRGEPGVWELSENLPVKKLPIELIPTQVGKALKAAQVVDHYWSGDA